MDTAIIYISKHGTTETVAHKLQNLIGPAQIINLGENSKPDLSNYSSIILGASIHMGQVHKKTKMFINQYKGELLNKELGLYLCCMEKGDKAKEQYDLAFPNELQNHAKANAMMGFEYLLEKMGYLEKKMMKKITGKDQSFSNINEETIANFALEFKK